jgi:hypothetical protein
MGKKDIGKILTTGSPKQRMLLIIEDIARGKYFEERLLTDSDFNQLANSFKKPNELRLWNEWKHLDETIANAIMNIQGLKFQVLMNYSNLRGYILVWNSIENAELLVNSVLHEIKDLKDRKRIAKDSSKGTDLLFSKTEPDQEGYVEIKVDFYEESDLDEDGNLMNFKSPPRKTREYSLLHVMNNVKKEVETSAIKYLSWERATLDFMEDKGFDIKTYRAQIKQMTEQVYSPIIGWAKYYGEINTGLPHFRLDEIIKKYAICPNIHALGIDEIEYNWFKRHVLDGNDVANEQKGKVNKSLSYE